MSREPEFRLYDFKVTNEIIVGQNNETNDNSNVWFK